MEKIFYAFTLLIMLSYTQSALSQEKKLDYRTIYSYALDGNIAPVITILSESNDDTLSESDKKFKNDFMIRFGYEDDRSDFLETKNSGIDRLLKLYRDYWRMALLDNSKNYDQHITSTVAEFLAKEYEPAKELNSASKDDSIDKYHKEYIASKGYKTTGFGKTGSLYDLLVWKNQTDTNYSFKCVNDDISAEVVFMDDFITLGWEEYATFGKFYPGGWATKEALFCVRSAYDLNSESFLISYLAHEGRHFSDYKMFPELSSADLEYRAKLTELAMLDTMLYRTIEHFISNGNYDSDNSHSIANYCIVRDLSKVLFDNEHEKDINKWRDAGRERINAIAYELLVKNTDDLNKETPPVRNFIKK